MGSSKICGMPGFRFHPTEQELVGFYLRRMVEGQSSPHDLIRTVDLYRYEPWELREIAPRTREKELFFFVPRDTKFPNGGRPNRRTKSGYWKATGTDRHVHVSVEDPANCVGLKKTLVYYGGRAPNGKKTDWIMNEYRLSYGDCNPRASKETLQNSITLCRIYRKDAPWRLGEARHDVETEAQFCGTSNSEHTKSFLQRANVGASSTAECFKLEDIGSVFPSTYRRFPASDENSVTAAPQKSQASPQHCLSYTSNWPQSNSGEQNFKYRGAVQAFPGEAVQSGSRISRNSYSAAGIAERHVPVMERKPSVLELSDLARCFDYTPVPATEVYTDSHLDIKDMEEIELWPSLGTDPLNSTLQE